MPIDTMKEFDGSLAAVVTPGGYTASFYFEALCVALIQFLLSDKNYLYTNV